MIKMYTAYTEEIDDVDSAVSEILDQLQMDGKLLKNSIGIIHCCSDFLDSGVAKALQEKLPFVILGCTTMSGSVQGMISQLGLTLSVLTSDDIQFVTVLSEPVKDDLNGPIEEAYKRLEAQGTERPSMLIPFIPFMMHIGGDEFIAKIDEVSGNLPAFGTLSISNEPDFSKVFTIYKGEGYATSLALLALIGKAAPLFLSVSVTEDNILKQKAVITKTNRNILQSINNMTAVQYIESIGLAAKGGDISGLVSMPFVVFLEDGSTLIRACIGSNPDGSLILCGASPVNSTLSIATMSPEDVISSTRAKLIEVLEKVQGRGILMYSCAARNWALGMKGMAEHETAAEIIGNKAPYQFIYSGGEIFPAELEGRKTLNHLQNNSMIICIL
jgi:hypothetical protein